jgi:hemerythrin-like domain-containing protein
MCEHCGCRQVEPIAELMDEHLELLDHAGEVRRMLDRGDLDGAWRRMGDLATLLVAHVDREEAGLFTAMKAQGDFAEAVRELEAEHVSFDELLSDLDRESPTLRDDLETLFAELTVHIDKENLGIFPVAVVTLGAEGWDTVARAHERSSS